MALEGVEDYTWRSPWLIEDVDRSEENMAEETSYPLREWNRVIVAVLFKQGFFDKMLVLGN